MGEVTEYYGITAACLRRWGNAGVVCAQRISKRGHWLYNAADLAAKFIAVNPAAADAGRAVRAHARRCIAYACVSSEKQRPNLERQVAALRAKLPKHEIVTNVARYV